MSCHLRGKVLLLLSAMLVLGAADHAKKESQPMAVPVIKIPRQPLLKTQSIPELDKLFAQAKPGDTLEVDLVFAGVKDFFTHPLSATDPTVKKGSVTFHTSDGYVRYLPGGKVVSHPDAEHTEKRLSFKNGQPRLQVVFQMPAEGKPPTGTLFICANRTNVVDEKGNEVDFFLYLSHALPASAEEGRGKARLKVQFSPDYEGQIGGWYIFQPM